MLVLLVPDIRVYRADLMHIWDGGTDNSVNHGAVCFERTKLIR
jgi:hypothetical protein